MNLTTVQFAVFVMIVLTIYYIVPQKHQWKCLLLSNLLFLWFAGVESILAVFLIGGISYTAAIFITKKNDDVIAQTRNLAGTVTEQKKAAKKIKKEVKQQNSRILAIGIALIVGIWMSSKTGVIQWFTPVAISYYSFIAISYVADVCQGKYGAETNFARYLTFLSFFPQLTEGPFSRYEIINREINKRHCFSLAQMEKGVMRMLYGYVKKMVLADSLWLILAPLLEQEHAGNWSTVLLIMLLPLQQYADFSGCMDIVIGLSELLGITLPENFRSPIFSKSIDEVWRRWHITLGAFCKDYIFYPVALNRTINKLGKKIGKRSTSWGKFFPVMTSLLCVWTFMGIWHGLSWKFLLWGWMNLTVIASSLMMENHYKRLKSFLHIRQNSKLYTIFCVCRTYLLFGIMEYMADGNSASWAIRGWKALFIRTAWSKEALLNLKNQIPDSVNLALCLCITIMVLIVDVLKERKISVLDWVGKQPVALKSVIYLVLFYIIILFIPNGVDINAGFAYANF